jgi:hypothetical protein
MPEPVWHDDYEVAARGICAAHHGATACGCSPERCPTAEGFSSFARASVDALRKANRLIAAPEPGQGTLALIR